MRAMVTAQFEAPDLFEAQAVERPRPGPGEVPVRIVAAGTNPIDANQGQRRHGTGGTYNPRLFDAMVPVRWGYIRS